MIECENGNSFKADYVIVTVSLGVLKSWTKTHVFYPELTLDKILSIEKLGFGVSEHFYIDFKPNNSIVKNISNYFKHTIYMITQVPLSEIYGNTEISDKIRINALTHSFLNLFWNPGNFSIEDNWIKGFFCIRYTKSVQDEINQNLKPLACLWITGTIINMTNYIQK